MTAGSAGNHAQALAFAARQFGVPCDIFVPAGAPITKIEACRAYGATVVEGGASLDEAMNAARARAAEAGMAFCHPFDDPAVVAGQGTLGLELVDDVPDLSCVVVPVGGGGLAAGTAIAVKSLLPHVRVVGVQAAVCAPYAGGPSPAGPGRHAGRRDRRQAPRRRSPRPLVATWVDELVAVDEDAIADAMVLLMDRAKLYVEGAGAVGVAAVAAGLVTPAATARRASCCPAATSTSGSCPASSAATRRRPGGASSCSPASTTGPGAWSGCSARSPPPAPTSSRSSTSARASTCTSARPASTPRSRSAAATTPQRVLAAVRGRRLPRPAGGRRPRERALGASSERRRGATRHVYLLVGRLCAMDDASLLRELEPTVEQLFDRHLATTKEWFPHQHVPYGRGRDYRPDEVWSPDDADLGGSTIDDAARSSLIVNLLTEDNLPYYFRTIERELGADGAWGAWAKRWTAEEMRHSMAIYGYLMVTRAVDPVALERSRMCQVSTGQVPRARPRRSTPSSTSRCRSWPPASPTATPGACSATAPATT